MVHVHMYGVCRPARTQLTCGGNCSISFPHSQPKTATSTTLLHRTEVNRNQALAVVGPWLVEPELWVYECLFCKRCMYVCEKLNLKWTDGEDRSCS